MQDEWVTYLEQERFDQLKKCWTGSKTNIIWVAGASFHAKGGYWVSSIFFLVLQFLPVIPLLRLRGFHDLYVQLSGGLQHCRGSGEDMNVVLYEFLMFNFLVSYKDGRKRYSWKERTGLCSWVYCQLRCSCNHRGKYWCHTSKVEKCININALQTYTINFCL